MNDFKAASLNREDQWAPTVRGFIARIETMMRSHGLWKKAGQDEIAYISEGLEKHIMQRLYNQ